LSGKGVCKYKSRFKELQAGRLFSKIEDGTKLVINGNIKCMKG